MTGEALGVWIIANISGTLLSDLRFLIWDQIPVQSNYLNFLWTLWHFCFPVHRVSKGWVQMPGLAPPPNPCFLPVWAFELGMPLSLSIRKAIIGQNPVALGCEHKSRFPKTTIPPHLLPLPNLGMFMMATHWVGRSVGQSRRAVGSLNRRITLFQEILHCNMSKEISQEC